MRVEIWGSQVHVVDLVSGSLLLTAAGFLVWSVWAIRRRGFRRYWNGVSKISVATMVVSFAILGAVGQMLGVIAIALLDAFGRSREYECYGWDIKQPGQTRVNVFHSIRSGRDDQD